MVAAMDGLFPPLPVFLDLAGRAVVLTSARAGFAPLARTLLDTGAGVTAFDPGPSPELEALSPSVRLIARGWRAADLTGAALVVSPAAGVRRARAAARAARALFLAPETPGLSDILLGSAIARGPLAFGVAAAGADPAIGEAIARRLGAAVPDGYGHFLGAAARAAARINAAIIGHAERRAFWQAAADAAFEQAATASSTMGARDWDLWIETRLPLA